MANYLAATMDGESAVYNVGSGTDITINKLARLVQEASGIAAPSIIHAPPRPAEVRHCRADITKARRELGFNPDSDIKTGLKEYFDWFKKDRE